MDVLKTAYRKFIPIAGITALLGIMIVLVWLGTEILSTHYSHRINNNDWIMQEKDAINYLHDYLVTRDSLHYEKFRREFAILQKRAQWGKFIIDPSNDKDSVIHVISNSTGQNAWDVKKSIFHDRRLRYFDTVDQTIEEWKALVNTLSSLDSLGRRVHASISKRPDDAALQQMEEQIRQFEDTVENRGRALNRQYRKASAWLQKMIITGTLLLAGLLWITSMAVILIMNRMQQKSERRLVERTRQLRLSKEKFSKLFDNSPLSVAFLDEEHCIRQVNKSFENLFGYTQEEIVGQQPNQFITPSDKQEEGRKIDEQTLRGNPVSKKSVRIDKKGNSIHVIITTVPVTDNGEFNGFFGIYTDITEQIENQKQLQETVKEREVLIQEIHHRVKNNLAIISGLLFMQAEQSNDIKTFEHLQDALSRIQSMALVHEQLYRQTESDAYIDMKEYLPKLVNSMRDTSERSKDEIKTNIEAINLCLPLTKAVPVGLLTTELLMNVFKHAFANQKVGHIEVTLSRTNSQIELTVADDGEGLPDDFRVDSGSLGMNIINNLVYQIEGDISFHSDPEEGTKFIVTFTHEKS